MEGTPYTRLLLFINPTQIAPPQPVYRPSTLPREAPEFNSPYQKNKSRIRWTNSGWPDLIPEEDPLKGKLVAPDYSKYKMLTKDEHLWALTKGEIQIEPKKTKENVDNEIKDITKVDPLRIGMRITLGDQYDLEEFAYQKNAISWTSWPSEINPAAGAFSQAGKYAWKLAIEA